MQRNWKNALCLLACLSCISCSRTSDVAVEDAKTAGRHLARGLKALFGDLRDSRLVTSTDVFAADVDEQSYSYELASGSEDIRAERSNFQPVQADSFELSGVPSIELFSDPGCEGAFQLVHFATDSSKLEGSNARMVAALARHLKSHPTLLVYIEGHCDQRGPSLYNLSLGSRRANAVRAALIQAGVPDNRLFTISYGKEHPILSANNAEAWAKNRRCQFKVFEAHQAP